MSKTKPLCDWTKKDLRERYAELCLLVSEPRHVCLKCGRAAHKKSVLCKPLAIVTPKSACETD